MIYTYSLRTPTGYIYKYIVINRQAVCFVVSQLFCVTRHAGRDRNPPNFTLELVSYHSAISVTDVSLGILTQFVLSFVCLYFALNSLEELYITLVAAVSSFARVLNSWKGSVIFSK